MVGDTTVSELQLRFAPDVLCRLGEELIPHAIQGIVELVKNAYDADATVCSIELIGVKTPGGTLRITDNGLGMTPSDIHAGWLILGKSGKVDNQISRKLGRLLVGDKGLGRLAALRLGTKAILRTRPEEIPGVEYELVLNWEEYSKADTIDSVKLTLSEKTTSQGSGTEIEVTGLRSCIDEVVIRGLSRSLFLLADPFESQAGFLPQLIAPEFPTSQVMDTDTYLGQAQYRLEATIGHDGIASAKVFDAFGSIIFENESFSDRDSYKTSPASFSLWVYLLSGDKFVGGPVSLRDVREWLSQTGGVHIYHRGLRVYPYGEPGHDWLDMNMRRTQSPEERPSTNTSIGRITVDDPQGMLIQKTDRIGFIETEPFRELRRFACDALDWMAKERLSLREKTRLTKKEVIARATSNAKVEVEKAMETIPAPARAAVEEAVNRLDRAREAEAAVLREDLLLYRTLATVGTTAAVFAHESAQPVRRISESAGAIHRIASSGPNLLSEFEKEAVGKFAEVITESSRSLLTFAGVPRSLLQRGKRKREIVNLYAVLSQLEELFTPFMESAGIDLRLEYDTQYSPGIRGSISALESVIANLVTNAIHALTTTVPCGNARVIKIQTRLRPGAVVILVHDNGAGIADVIYDDMWLPGKTTKRNGTGLGLTIARDTVVDLRGTIEAHKHGELGGATFMVTLPVEGEADGGND